MTTHQADLRKWTKGQPIEQLIQKIAQEAKGYSFLELKVLCKERKVRIRDIKFFCPDFFNSVLEESRNLAIKEIVLETNAEEKNPRNCLKTLIKQKNSEYGLNQYSEKVSYDDIRNYDPEWFDTTFGPRYYDYIPDIHERDRSHPPTFLKLLDED